MPTPTLNQTSRLKTWVGAAAWSRLGLVAAAALIASGCSMLQEDKIDYKSAQRGSTLDVPPDLTQLSRDIALQRAGHHGHRQRLPGRPASTGHRSHHRHGPVGDVRIERAGNQRWLVVEPPGRQTLEPRARLLAGERFPARHRPGNAGHHGNRLGRKPRQDAAGFHPLDHRQGVREPVFHRRTRPLPHPPGAHRQRRHRDLHQPPRHGRGLLQHAKKTRPSGNPARPTWNSRPSSCAA